MFVQVLWKVVSDYITMFNEDFKLLGKRRDGFRPVERFLANGDGEKGDLAKGFCRRSLGSWKILKSRWKVLKIRFESYENSLFAEKIFFAESEPINDLWRRETEKRAIQRVVSAEEVGKVGSFLKIVKKFSRIWFESHWIVWRSEHFFLLNRKTVTSQWLNEMWSCEES